MSDRRVFDEIYPDCPFPLRKYWDDIFQLKHEETFSLPLHRDLTMNIDDNASLTVTNKQSSKPSSSDYQIFHSILS